MQNRRVGPLEVHTNVDGLSNMASDHDVEGGRDEMTLQAVNSADEDDSNDDEGSTVYFRANLGFPI